jgi:iduronate 2-sulfatase
MKGFRLVSCMILVLCNGKAVLELQAADRPSPVRLNVLFIIVDDLRNALGCYGDQQVKSPNIDELAARGMQFDRAYCQYPFCNPSRASLLTGLRPDTTQVLDNTVNFRKHLPEVVTLPQLFRQHGYFTASLGKIFHRGLTMEEVRGEMDDTKSWDVTRYFQTTPLGNKGEGRNLTGGHLSWCRWLAAAGSDEDQPDGQIAAAAVRLLETHRDQPFFLGVGFHKPHDPFIAPKRYFDLYPLAKLKLARDPDTRSLDVPLAIPTDWKEDFARFTDRERLELLRAYYAGTSFIDAQVGSVLNALDRAA